MKVNNKSEENEQKTGSFYIICKKTILIFNTIKIRL